MARGKLRTLIRPNDKPPAVVAVPVHDEEFFRLRVDNESSSPRTSQYFTTAIYHDPFPRARVRARLVRTAKPSRDKGMNSIRLKITIHLNGNHALSVHQLNAIKSPVEKGIAASLPDWIAVDTINVTKVTETRPSEHEGAP